MRNSLHSVLFILTLFSCKQSKQEDAEKQEVPKALQEKSIDVSSISKRSNDRDLVENLYAEIVENDDDLKKLEKDIADLKSAQNDSAEIFKGYDQKNRSYYNSAEMHISQIKDSVLRERVKMLISRSSDNYNEKTANFKNLLEEVSTKAATLADLHNILKVQTTIPVIEKYQKENLPATDPLISILKQFDKSINKVDSLTGTKTNSN